MFDGVVASLPAADVTRAKAFYRDKLGLEPAEAGSEGTAFYQIGETTFLLYQSEFSGTNQATAAAFNVSDIGSVVGDLQGKGVVFEEYDFGDAKTVDGIMTMPDGTSGAWFKDSEGNILGVFQQA